MNKPFKYFTRNSDNVIGLMIKSVTELGLGIFGIGTTVPIFHASDLCKYRGTVINETGELIL